MFSAKGRDGSTKREPRACPSNLTVLHVYHPPYHCHYLSFAAYTLAPVLAFIDTAYAVGLSRELIFDQLYLYWMVC